MGFLNEVKTRRYRAWKTVCMGLLWTGLGLSSSAYGPSLLDLTLQVNSTIDQTTRLLPVRAFGAMLGSIICGFVLEKIDIQIVLIFSMFFLSASIFFIPFCYELWQLFIVFFNNGIFSGFLVNSGNFFIIHTWGKVGGSFMQFAHFSFGIGGFFGPIIIRPYLTEVEDDDSVSSTPNPSLTTTLSPTEAPDTFDPSTLKLRTAYFIIGCCCLCFFVLFLVTYLIKRSNEVHPSREVKQSDEEDLVENSEKKIKFSHKATIVMLTTLFAHLTYGIELLYGSMLATYANLSVLHLTKSNAALLTSLYWFAFTFFRLISLVIIIFFSSKTMLIITLFLLMAGNFVLLPLISYNYEILLWIGSAIIGFSISTSVPCMTSHLETILPVSGKIISLMSTGQCIAEFILPVVVGLYIKSYPNIFIYNLFLYSTLSCITFIVFCICEYIVMKHKRS